MYIAGLSAADTTAQGLVQNSVVLDKEDFLKLLTAQLQYQDPMAAQDSSQYMEQMTNLAVLEQVQNISTCLSSIFDAQQQFEAINLLGRKLVALDQGGNEIAGTVQSIKFTETGPQVNIDGTEFSLGQIQEIKVQDQGEEK